MSDEDRRYDAWIPSQHTQQILVEMTTGATAAPLNATIEHLTMPGIVLDEPLVKPLTFVSVCVLHMCFVFAYK